ncbi:MAG: sigma-54-dependent Fis family transcriptional regulator [Deltaproteobacteria bacterium]|nr:sigma-54-dependent Fis family transcriptional regulator [Deltaproteobacteria bacterium]
MKKFKMLIAEDNDLSRANLVELLEAEGYLVTATKDGREAMEAFPCDKYDLVITDLKMPHADGLELLKFVKEVDPNHVVIIMTGYATVNSAVEAMKLGAFDYITKPLRDDLVKITIERALSYACLAEENITLKESLREKYDFGNMIGFSDAMKDVFETIRKVSSSDSTVLIYGESGTGKELVARALHFNSDRRNRQLITVNCGAIPEDLLESEFFGHEKGAFTGAIRSKMGRFELAQGGTIFLDEIGDMSPSLQVKVLRVIQEKQFERIGGTKTIETDVRIIAATHQNLEKAVEEKKFREDLFYRINVIPIHVPPLRDHRVDIPPLINHFLKKFNRLKKKNVQGVSPEAMRLFINYRWPGNVRELQNVVEMLVVLKEQGFIEQADLPKKIHGIESGKNDRDFALEVNDEGINLNEEVSRFEKMLIEKALAKSGGVKNKAAQFLRLNRTTLVEKLKRYNIAR